MIVCTIYTQLTFTHNMITKEIQISDSDLILAISPPMVRLIAWVGLWKCKTD